MPLVLKVLCQNKLLEGNQDKIQVMCQEKPFAEGRDGCVWVCEVPEQEEIFIAKEYKDARYQPGRKHTFEIASELQGLECTDSRFILAVDGQTYYFILPYLGKDLHQERKEGRAYAGLGLAQFLCLLTNVWDSLQVLHEKGMIHGDIKNNNVVVNKDRTMMFLIDFSLCTRIIDNHCTELGPWVQVSIETQFNLPRGIKDDVRAFLVLVVDLILQGRCYCDIKLQKGKKVYKFGTLKQNLEDKLKTKLDAWPTLQKAILEAYRTVRDYDQESLRLILDATDKNEACKPLRTLGDEYLPRLTVCVENVISCSQNAVAESEDTRGV